MNETEMIYDSFYDIDPNDSMGIIRLYENNQIILDNISSFKDKDDFSQFVLLAAQYVISLEKVGKYTKSIKYADRLLQMIELNKDEFQILINDYTTFWSVLTSKGRSLFYLKNYKNSVLIFKRLLEWDSENDNFRLWLESSQSRKRKYINQYLLILSIIIFITKIFIGNYIDNPKIKIYMLFFGFILILIALINEYFVDKVLKINKKE
jgi:tetratricopeptide (TPR) repeat protein